MKKTLALLLVISTVFLTCACAGHGNKETGTQEHTETGTVTESGQETEEENQTENGEVSDTPDTEASDTEDLPDKGPEPENVLFKNGLVIVEKDGLLGFADKKGNIAVEAQFDMVYPFEENGLAFVEKDGKYEYIDKNGNAVVKIQYDGLDFFGEAGIAAAERDGGCTLVNEKGEEIVPLYDTIGSMESEDGLIDFSICDSSGEKKYGYLNIKGETVIEPQFKWPSLLKTALHLS